MSTIKSKLSLELSTESIKEILSDKLKDFVPGFEVDAVTFNVSNAYDMRGEPCGSKVSGVKVTFKYRDQSF